jgi:hypothetical protein
MVKVDPRPWFDRVCFPLWNSRPARDFAKFAVSSLVAVSDLLK